LSEVIRKFSTISSIELDDANSWKTTLFLTLDIDWCHDDVLAYSIDLLERADVSATWFVTHDTPLLDRLRANPKFELGIHPNFNFLLQGDFRNGSTAEEVVDRLLAIVPEASCVRSHSMTQSSVLLDIFYKKGLRYDCNHFIPIHLGLKLEPFRLWNKLIRVPYSWEDDIDCLYSANGNHLMNINNEQLSVFDFHPIHIFLNTPELSLYERTRSFHHQPRRLFEARWQGEGGVETWLQEVIRK
jgi:hypothetical protein